MAAMAAPSGAASKSRPDWVLEVVKVTSASGRCSAR